MSPGRAALLAGGLLLAPQSPVAAQTSVTAAIGENADAATGATSGATAFLGLSRFGAAGGARIAAGLPLEAGNGSRWGSASGWLDMPHLVDRFGLLGSARAFAYRDVVLGTSGGAASGDLQAYATFPGPGPVLFRVRAGALAGGLSDADITVRRSMVGAGADATVAGQSFVARASLQAWAAAEAVYPQLAAQGMAYVGEVMLHGRVARWFHEDLPGTGWSLGAELRVTDRLTLFTAASRAETDILFFSPTQRSWSVGLRYGGAPPPPRALPVPVIASPDQAIRLEVQAPDGGEVRLAGTFNDWQPQPMQLEGDHWVTELRLPPGIYEYAFVAEDGTWFVPEGAPGRKPDGYGGFVATIVIR